MGLPFFLPAGLLLRPNSFVVALVGNPNTGKSTLFNALTGLRQHTGNWPGKTVDCAVGVYRHKEKEILLVDLPGTYSLFPFTPEERLTRDFLCFGRPEASVVVVDATSLERNLPLVLEVLEIIPKAVVSLNLIDEAERKGIEVDTAALSSLLGVPVVRTAARHGVGLGELREVLDRLLEGTCVPKPVPLEYPAPIEEALAALGQKLAPFLGSRLAARWAALCLLEGEQAILENRTVLALLYERGEENGHGAEGLFGRDPSSGRRPAGPPRRWAI